MDQAITYMWVYRKSCHVLFYQYAGKHEKFSKNAILKDSPKPKFSNGTEHTYKKSERERNMKGSKLEKSLQPAFHLNFRRTFNRG